MEEIMYYDIKCLIAEYLFPWEYSCIDREFHDMAMDYCMKNPTLPQTKLYYIIYACSIDNKEWVRENVNIHDWLEILDKFRVSLDLLDHIGRRWMRDDEYCNEKYVDLCTRTIDDENVSKVKFLKDCVLFQRKHRYSTNPIPNTMFPYYHLLKNRYLSSIIGFKASDVEVFAKYQYLSYRVPHGFIEHAGNNLQSILNKIGEYYDYHDYIVELFKEGYNVPTDDIRFSDLVRYGISNRAHELFSKEWIIANCPLDGIKNNGIVDDDIKLEDIIKNRNYPVFKTYYKGDGNPDELLNLAIEYKNTEAFAVLLKYHSYSDYPFWRVRTNVKGIKRLIKIRLSNYYM